MKKLKKINISKFEMLVESKDVKMVGGFSPSISAQNISMEAMRKNSGCQTTNNCNGGNCATGCGVKTSSF